MPITTEERRFLRNWEEQRQGGKNVFVATYTFGLTFLIFLCSIALALFMNLPFIKVQWISVIAISSVIGGWIVSLLMWRHQEKKFRRIINRVVEESK